MSARIKLDRFDGKQEVRSVVGRGLVAWKFQVEMRAAVSCTGHPSAADRCPSLHFLQYVIDKSQSLTKERVLYMCMFVAMQLPRIVL